jgi:hypothetical protein
MGQFLFYYQRPEPATWVFLSSFLVVGLFFMFHRLWSMRNLDVVLLILLAPGLMMVYEGRKKRLEEPDRSALVSGHEAKRPNAPSRVRYVSQREIPGPGAAAGPTSISPGETAGRLSTWSAQRLEYWGFVWLFVVCGLLVIRMLVDTAMVRRPLLEPNLSSGGLTFIGVSLFLFLMANVLTSQPEEQRRQGARLGPGYVLLNMLPDISTTPDEDLADSLGSLAMNADLGPDNPVPAGSNRSLLVLARALAILSNCVIVAGTVAIGWLHFGNVKTGIGAATLFLLLPYTAQMTGRVDHVLPGALLVLALLSYRKPLLSGLFLGCAAGLVYYPFFLLPLWLSFYWQRGLRRFLMGLGVVLVGLMSALAFGPTGLLDHLRQMYGVFLPAVQGLEGIWGYWHPYFRLPVLVAFVILCLSFTFWPVQKSFGTLLCCSGAIMIAAQFWHGYGGGLYMAWFLPMVILTVFRPNLDDRIALNVVRPSRPREQKAIMPLPQQAPLAQAG